MRTRLISLMIFSLILVALYSVHAEPTEERYPPVVTAAFSNTPGWITLAWQHEWLGVYGFQIQLKDPETGEWYGVRDMDHTYAQFTLVGLEPGQWYTVRVCAVYGPNDDADWECSTEEPAVQTMALPAPGSWGAPPTITSHAATEDRITIWWHAPQSYGFFHVRWARQGDAEVQDRIERGGHDGSHAIAQLQPGQIYVFRLQGCNRTLLGSSCGHWSPQLDISTAFPPLHTPTLTAVPDTDRPGMIVLHWQGGVDFTNTNVVLLRDGQLIYDAWQETGITNPHFTVTPRHNTEYTYTLCFVREAWACSNDVTAMARPVTPTAPTAVTVQRRYLPGGGIGPLGLVTHLTEYIEVSWANPELPGQFLTVEREETRVRRSTGGGVLSGLWLLERRWIELERLTAKDNPTVAMVDPPSAFYPTVTDAVTYRVCAVVPALGDAGRVCSAPATLP